VIGLAMEHVAGTPLDQRLAARGRLSIDETLEVGIAIASALSAVHRAGLVHRDVKPANVIEAAGVYKLIDFGIAAADPHRAPAPGDTERAVLDDLPPEAVGSRLSALVTAGETCATTAAGVACGTFGYLDPICLATSAPADPTSDLYSLGAMLFECLAGDVLDGRAPAPPLLDVAPSAPPSLARLVDALLSPARGDRPVSAELVAVRLEEVRRDRAGLARALPPEDVGPFRGLGRFQERDRDVYFGRAGDVAAALEVLRSRGLTALIGPSGSGKSSLVRAGLLPAIAEGALGEWPAQWDSVVAEPGRDPRAAVTALLAPLAPGAAALAPGALVAALADRVRKAGRGVVLVLDQLEELCTRAEASSRDYTAELLVRLSERAVLGVRALVTVRRDLLDPLLALGPLGKALVHGSVLLEPISELSWGVVLDQALAAYGYAFEDEALKREILGEIERTASAMPLVQFALSELWQTRDRSQKKVTRAGLGAIGGLAGALERHAEATLRELAGAEHAAKAVLLALTTPQGTRATRSLAELSGCAGPKSRDVIDAFERARLFVSGAEGVTLVHEALLTQWGRLRAWVAEEREDRLLGEELERDAARYRESPELEPLWRRQRLASGERLLRRGGTSLSADAVAFLKAGRWAERRALLAVAGSAAAALLAIGSMGVAYVRAVQAKEEATHKALLQEQASRELAERKAREIQEAQDQIDRLLQDLAESPSKETVRSLQRQIREGRGAPEASSRERPAIAAGSARAATAAVPSQPAPESPAPQPSAEGPADPVLHVETDW
jgi:eukaryotic-like serine/threonine-protein kinase